MIDTRTNRETYEIATETEDFRTYKAETVKNDNGEWVTITLCEELVEGRWEPFVSVRKVK